MSDNEYKLFGPAGIYKYQTLPKADGVYEFRFYKGKNLLSYSKKEQEKYFDKSTTVSISFYRGSIVNFRFN